MISCLNGHLLNKCHDFSSPDSASASPCPVEPDPETGLSDCIWALPNPIPRSSPEPDDDSNGSSLSPPVKVCRKDYDAQTLIYTSTDDELETDKEKISKYLSELGWEQPFQGLSLHMAENILNTSISSPDPCSETDQTGCESVGGTWNNEYQECNNVPGCAYLRNHLHNSPDIYKTWETLGDDFSIFQIMH